jgi:small-conductance mechanosensitive channel
LPLSSLAGWGLVTVGFLMVLHVLGINIQPLLTLGGFSTLALGIGAQSITSNAISGLNLVRPRQLAHLSRWGMPRPS